MNTRKGSKRILSITVRRMIDTDPDTSDWGEYASSPSWELCRGDCGYVGIRVDAEVQFGSDVVQRVTSGGLWGIESDSDKSYFEEVEGDELAALRTILGEMGFSKRAIATACKRVERRDE